jgi:hypothetical protein
MNWHLFHVEHGYRMREAPSAAKAVSAFMKYARAEARALQGWASSAKAAKHYIRVFEGHGLQAVRIL